MASENLRHELYFTQVFICFHFSNEKRFKQNSKEKSLKEKINWGTNILNASSIWHDVDEIEVEEDFKNFNNTRQFWTLKLFYVNKTISQDGLPAMNHGLKYKRQKKKEPNKKQQIFKNPCHHQKY